MKFRVRMDITSYENEINPTVLGLLDMWLTEGKDTVSYSSDDRLKDIPDWKNKVFPCLIHEAGSPSAVCVGNDGKCYTRDTLKKSIAENSELPTIAENSELSTIAENSELPTGGRLGISYEHTKVMSELIKTINHYCENEFPDKLMYVWEAEEILKDEIDIIKCITTRRFFTELTLKGLKDILESEDRHLINNLAALDDWRQRLLSPICCPITNEIPKSVDVCVVNNGKIYSKDVFVQKYKEDPESVKEGFIGELRIVYDNYHLLDVINKLCDSFNEDTMLFRDAAKELYNEIKNFSQDTHYPPIFWVVVLVALGGESYLLYSCYTEKSPRKDSLLSCVLFTLFVFIFFGCIIKDVLCKELKRYFEKKVDHTIGFFASNVSGQQPLEGADIENRRDALGAPLLPNSGDCATVEPPVSDIENQLPQLS